MNQGSLLTQAAKGDHFAQGELAALIVSYWQAGMVQALEALSAAELLGRMAATSGEHSDVRGLASVLFLRANVERSDRPALADRLDAEAIRLLDGLSDDGDEIAATTLCMAGPHCSPDAWRIARDDLSKVTV